MGLLIFLAPCSLHATTVQCNGVGLFGSLQAWNVWTHVLCGAMPTCTPFLAEPPNPSAAPCWVHSVILFPSLPRFVDRSEDVETAQKAGLPTDPPDADTQQLYRDLASGAESGAHGCVTFRRFACTHGP